MSVLQRRARHKAVIVVIAAAAVIVAASVFAIQSDAARPTDTAKRHGVPANTIIVAIPTAPQTLDPHQTRVLADINLLKHFYDPLVLRDAKDPTKFLPVLAVSWKHLSAKVWRFTLRKGVKFSDGQEFDAATVKYNIDRVIGKLPSGQPPALILFQAGTLASARVVSKYVVDIVTNQPDALLLSRVAPIGMIPNHSVDADPKALTAAVDGTGPFTLVRWDRNNEVVMKARPNYFRGRAAVGNVVFKTLPDASSRIASLRAGDVDIITGVPTDNIPEITRSGNAKVVSVSSVALPSITFDTLGDFAPLKSKKVRQAMNYAVNKRVIVNTILSGYGVLTATVVPPYFVGFDRRLPVYPYNPAKAKQLLAEAGYPNGFSMTLMVPRGIFLAGELITQAIAQYLTAVGIRTQVQILDPAAFAQTTNTRHLTAPAFYAVWNEINFNPISEFQVRITCSTKSFSWYCNPAVDRLTRKALSTFDESKQAAIIKQIQRIIYDDAAMLYLFAYRTSFGISNRISWQPRKDELVYIYEAKLK